MEPTGEACLCDRHAVKNQFSCMQETPVSDIIADCVTCFCFKQAHHIIPADVKCLCKSVDIEVFCEMGIDILHNVNDFRVIQFCVKELHMILDCCTVQLDHKLKEQDLPV